MANLLELVEDDNNVDVTVTLTAGGSAVDLTGCTVDLIFRIDGASTTVSGTPDADQVNNTGQATFVLTSTHLATSGRGSWEVQVTSGSDVHTFPSSTAPTIAIRADQS